MNETLLTVFVSSLVALLVAAIPTGVSWFLAKSQRKKIDADAAGVLTGAALNIVKELQEQVKCLQARVRQLEEELGTQKGLLKIVTELNAGLLRGTAILSQQITDLGEEPCWQISDAAGEDASLRRELRRLQGELD